MNVLDVSCCPGRLTIPLAHIVGYQGEVTAMDIQEGMLQEVRKRVHTANLTNIQFLHVATGERKLEHERFDRAVLITVLGEIPHRNAALQEIFDALRPGVILVIEKTVRDPHFQTRKTANRLAGAAGFIEKEFSGNYFSYTFTLEKPDSKRLSH